MYVVTALSRHRVALIMSTMVMAMVRALCVTRMVFLIFNKGMMTVAAAMVCTGQVHIPLVKQPMRHVQIPHMEIIHPLRPTYARV